MGEHQGGIPNWVWGMLVGVLIFAGGFYLGNRGNADTIDAGGGSFVEEETTSTTAAATGLTVATVRTETTATNTAPEIERFEQFSLLPPVLVTELPGEALDTLDLIASGGPYPFDRDGLTFQNREALLPDRPQGHYQEFTVITPGLDHRGARRIVAGADGELYYTSDHYESFREIVTED